MKYIFIGIIVVLVLLVGLIITRMVDSEYEKEIEKWVSDRGETLVKCERHLFDTGPYFVSKNLHIFRVETNKSIYWFRYGFLYENIEQETNDGYIVIK